MEEKKIIGIKDLTCTFECIITYYSKCIALDWNECKKIKAYWEWKNEYWIFDTSLQIRQIWNEICLCENKFNYNTPYILFNSLCTQSKSYFGHIKNSNSKRESVNIYHVTLTLLKVLFLSCALLKCWENCIEEILIGFFLVENRNINSDFEYTFAKEKNKVLLMDTQLFFNLFCFIFRIYNKYFSIKINSIKIKIKWYDKIQL